MRPEVHWPRGLLLLLLAGSVTLGVLLIRSPWIAIGFCTALVATWGVLEVRARPVLAAVAFLGYMNALPFIDLSAIALPAGLRYDDLAMFTLLVLSVVWTSGVDRGSPIWKLKRMLIVISLYWLLVVAQTVLTGDGTLVHSLLYGRDLLAIVMALSFAYVASSEKDLSVFLAVVVAIAGVYAIAHLLQAFVGIDTSIITHPYKTSVSGTASRIFFRAADMIAPLLLISVGHALVSTSRRAAFFYWGASLVFALDVMGQFTRASYLAMVVAFALGAVMLSRLRADRPQSRATVMAMIAALVALGVWVVAGSRRMLARVMTSAVGARLFSAGGDIATQGGTFGYRLTIYQTMLSVLGARWVTGLGFWHPAEHYVAVLPQGAIRNNDTGILGVLMTMGIVGVLVLAWPLVWAARLGLASIRAEESWIRAVGWATICYAAWVATTLFSLGFLSQGSGLAATALIVGLMAGARQAEETSQ